MIVYVCDKKSSSIIEPFSVEKPDHEVAIESAMMFLRDNGADTSGMFGLAVIEGGKNAVQKV